MMNGGTPGFTAVFAGLLVGRRTTGPQLLGVAVGFVGIVLVSLPSLGEGSSEATGVGLVVLATVYYGVALNLVAPLQARYGSRPVMARTLALATLWTMPLGVAGLSASETEHPRADARPAGKEGVSPWDSRWSPSH